MHRSDLDRFSEDLVGVIEGSIVTVLPNHHLSSSVQYAHLERAADGVEFVVSIEERDPDRWCAVREQDLGSFELPGDAIRIESWIAIPPDAR